MTKIHTVVLVVLTLAVSVVAVADEVQKCEPFNLDLGAFVGADTDYVAWSAALSHGRWCWYEEVDTRSDYDLTIINYRFSERGDKAVLRLDDGKVRIGVSSPITAGFSARFLAGEGPERIDVWTPSLPITKVGDVSLSVYGWFQAQTECEPNVRVCPMITWEKLSVEYDYDFNRSAGDYWYLNWSAITWP